MRDFSRFSILIAIASLFALTICGCRADCNSRTLMVSIEPQRYLLERIAGNEWSVSALLDRNSDPENFEPSMSSLKAASDCRAYFTVGQLAFEDELISRLQDGNPDLTTITTSTGIDLIKNNICDSTEAHGGESDPHVWCSVANAKIMAGNMCDAMTKLDPSNSDIYRANCNRLIAELDSLDRAISNRLNPARGSSFMVWHPSLSYFARDYGLHQLTLGSENKELSATALRDKIEKASASSAKVLFIDSSIDRRRGEEIASQIGADCKTLNLTAYNWLDDLDQASRDIASSYQTDSAR